MLPVKRPKPGETEEDLLSQEKEFLKNVKLQNVAPAAKVVKLNHSSSVTSTIPTRSEQEQQSFESTGPLEGVPKEENIEYPDEAVLFEIREREFEPSKLKEFVKSDLTTKVIRVTPLPKDAGLSDSSGAPGAGQRKKSLFAKSFDARQEARRKEMDGRASTNMLQPLEKIDTQHAAPSLTSSSLPGAEVIGDKIHPLLAGMTEEDILLEQKKLLERLDPKLVEFIRSRSQNQNIPLTSQVQDGSPFLATAAGDRKGMEEQMEVSTEPVVDEDDLPINPKTVDQFLGMQKVEKSKLAWAGVINDIETGGTVKSQSGNKSARFDFMGVLLSDDALKDSTTYEKALHNHGAEMERPGYTIEELLILARSTNMQQRSIALDTLGNICAQAHTGIYDEILEKSIFHLLDYMDFIHVIRKGLDNTDSSSINAALFCLSSLLYVECEEACLDATFLWPNSRPFPLLTTKPEEAKKDNAETDLKDFEYLQLDLLDFLISRTEILTRIEYLLTSMNELINEKGVTSILKILIRLVRHSPNTVMRHERLLKYIVENHVSGKWILLRKRERNLKGIPLIHALKLMRVLVESSDSNAMKIYHNYNLFSPVMAYLAYNEWREQSHVEEVENLVLESFKIWLSFLEVGIGIDEYVSFFPIIMQFLTFYGLSNHLNSFDLHHSAHLFSLLTNIICFGSNSASKSQPAHSHWDLVKDAVSLVEQHCLKIMKMLPAPPFVEKFSTDLALLSLGKGLEFLSHSIQHMKHGDLSNQWGSISNEFYRSETCSNLTSNLMSHSVILEATLPKSRYSSNFASIGAIKWRSHLNPVMRANSPFFFLSHFINFLRRLAPSQTSTIIVNSAMENYLAKLKSFNKTGGNADDECDYFVRFELSFLSELLSILPKDYSVEFPVAYKSLALVPTSCTILFQKLLKESLETCCDRKDADAVYQFYLAYFIPDDPSNHCESPSKSTKVRFDDGGHPGDGMGKEGNSPLLFQQWSSKLVEPHWIFHPLENLYRRAVSTPGYVKDNIEVLEQETRGCLSFINHCLRHNCNSIIQTSQDLVTVYCRICRVFMLGNPNVYIDEVTIPVLQEILRTLVSGKVLASSKKCIFSNRKPSTSAAVSFYDFYTELVTEYYDNSYFNEVFASFLLLPLRPQEDVNVKGAFWSHEHLKFVRLTQDKVPISIEYLTVDQEKDPKMLNLYATLLKRKLVLKDRNPFLYDVVATHLRNSAEFMTDGLRKDMEKLCL